MCNGYITCVMDTLHQDTTRHSWCLKEIDTFAAHFEYLYIQHNIIVYKLYLAAMKI